MRSDATLSSCGTYRYSLSRSWNHALPSVAFIGVNPSTADAEKNDPTILKCIGFASRMNFGGLVMLNRYSYRATKPSDLWKAAAAGTDVVGEDVAAVFARATVCELVVACWGRHGLKGQSEFVESFGRSMACLGTNSDGTPCHPLMLPYSTKLEKFLIGGSKNGPR